MRYGEPGMASRLAIVASCAALAELGSSGDSARLPQNESSMNPSEFQTLSAGDASQTQFRVRLLGWRVGFRKITATQFIRRHTHLNLVESKRCVDDCLERTERVLIPKSEQDARSLATELHRCGAEVSLE